MQIIIFYLYDQENLQHIEAHNSSGHAFQGK